MGTEADRSGGYAATGLLVLIVVMIGGIALVSYDPPTMSTGSPSASSQVTDPGTTIGIYVHRIPAPYWAPCFASVCSAGTGPGAAMYMVLYDSAGQVVQSGFADENGHFFSGLTPGETYYVYPEDCNLCHGSEHNVVFQHWGDGGATRPLAVVPGTSLDARTPAPTNAPEHHYSC